MVRVIEEKVSTFLQHKQFRQFSQEWNFTQVAKPAATAVSCATSSARCTSGSVEGFKSTVFTLNKHFLCLVCSASGSLLFSHDPSCWIMLGMGRLVDRSVVTFQSLKLQMPVICSYCNLAVIFFVIFFGSSNATRNGNELTGAHQPRSHAQNLRWTHAYTYPNDIALVCSKPLQCHQL